jgi:hypothetical protein
VEKCWLVTGVIGGDNNAGVVGFWNTSFARYGGERDPIDGEDGGDELGCRYGDEPKYEDEEDGVNIPGDRNAGDDGDCRLNRW